ncbi:S-crystallin 4 isoform X1 [Hydra vulgaris]|uniref:S-crystallin 4 isoform X1 n=1 Tax=Hydra vulgaris TaxID=6087 RepID=UPI0002B4A238|nr:S-crystallin 4 [Hydra vulgaris]
MSTKYVLNYFGFQGRGEIARLLFHYKGVEFTDNKVNDWPAHKSDRSRFPLGQMPTLEVDGQVICQSTAINVYLAEIFCMNGANASERAVINQVCETLNDLVKEYLQIWMNSTLNSDQKIKEFEQLFANETTKLKFSFMESLLQRNNNGLGFFVGNSISLGDLTFFTYSGLADESFLSNYPLLLELNKRIRESPELKSYLDSRTHPLLP